MPFAIAGPVLGAVAGAGVSSALSPGTSGGGSSLYVPTGLSNEDNQWQAIQGMLGNNFANQNLQQYGLQSLYGGLNANLNYGNGYQNAANAAGQQYTNLGNTLNSQSAQNFGTQASLLGAGQQVYNMGLDPQNALYNSTLNQVQQQTGATNSMYGLGSSGAGAGVANQALTNFNQNWQNNQLSRAAQGLSAYDSAAQAAGGYGQLGTQQASAAPGATLAGGSTPYTTGQTLAATPGQVAGQYGSFLNSNFYGPGEAINATGQNYLNPAMGQSATAFNAANQGAGALGSAVSSGVSGLGNAYQNAGSLGNLFGGTTGSFGSGDFSGAFSSNPYYGGGGNSYGFTM